MDLRGIPTTACPNCNSAMLKINVRFDPETYEIAMYMLDCECAECGSLLTAPTPIDREAEDEF